MAPANWNTREQIQTHQLSVSIINGHGTENDVFDDTQLALLKRFCLDPTATTRGQILDEFGWNASEPQAAAAKASREGSLVGFLVARHGTEDPALDERDLELLKEWFVEGMPVGRAVVR